MTILSALKFNDLYEKLQDSQIPIATAYKLAKIKGSIKSDIDFYKTSLNTILDKYALRDNNGNYVNDNGTVKIQAGKIEICQKEINELEQIVVNQDTNLTFTIEELSTLQLTLSDMETLLPYIK